MKPTQEMIEVVAELLAKNDGPIEKALDRLLRYEFRGSQIEWDKIRLKEYKVAAEELLVAALDETCSYSDYVKAIINFKKG